MAAKVELGRLLVTPGAVEAAERTGDDLREFLVRRAAGDWGTVNDEDKRANDRALREESRLLSAYLLSDRTKIWIITESDRMATTVLLPEEY